MFFCLSRCVFPKHAGIDETVEMIRANGGTAVGYKVDISKKEEVYKAADALRRDVGDVSTYSFFVFIHKHFVKTIKMNVEC